MQLIKSVNTYRCNDEDEAQSALDRMKNSTDGEITKSVIALKTKKSKGEIIDSWAQLEVTTTYEVE